MEKNKSIHIIDPEKNVSQKNGNTDEIKITE